MALDRRRPLARRVALETADWLLREMRTPEGGFASALDADSEGEEGKFYVWTPEQLREVLGERGRRLGGRLFEVTGHVRARHLGAAAARRPGRRRAVRRVRAALLAARARRVRPGRDDKVVAAWNGLAIAALAEAGALFDRPDLVEAARAAAVLLDEVHMDGGRLLRTSRDGRAGRNAGVLEDYADLAEGLIALYGVTGRGALVPAGRGRCWTPCSTGSPTARAGSSTPPTTPSGCSSARRTPPTTPPPPASSPRPGRCCPTRR